MLCPEALTRLAAETLHHHAEQLAREQAVRGIDALAELDLHPILRQGFALAGLGVLAEWPYPSEPGGKIDTPTESPAALDRRRPLRRERLRCDVVLLPAPGKALTDPVAARTAAEEAARAAPLFQPLMVGDPGAFASGDPDTLLPQEAFWLEVKVVGQFTFTAGIPSPNRTYTAELLSGTGNDAAKLASDPMIRRGGAMVILFTADIETAEHDLGVLRKRFLERGPVTGTLTMQGFSIADHIGNRWCTVAMMPVG